ncbi:MAG: carboxypeptidase-like regulatory domain-containing protein, partial [Blastocatellia bacterium]
MRQLIRLLALLAFVALGCAAPAHASAGRGSIRGVVMDASGTPLIGADVVVLASTEAVKADKVVKRASTDGEGKFNAAGIAPGRYRVKAEADGFKPVEIAADVKPNKVTVFDSIFLRRLTTLSDDTSLHPDSKYAARSIRGTIFHYDESKKDSVGAEANSTIALTGRSTELHGAVNAFAQSTAS